jgi:thiol-disulfide isomerase/thioredoxin
LKFTATNGTEVDLEKMRGKVILVDFWASWCGPCIGELPNVVATYKKLHDKGFEIVGISLDQDQGKMEEATKKLNMTWPQHFDGGGWQNKISTSFGIRSIPAAWLLDKKGMLRETNLRGEALGTAVEKLLAE